ncbi:tetratricopeptide repeat-containing sensor histidine kinase [uncultured Tenacibaculum sp.]|uniref:tetratricopeptide repeat-containing sensor histidine kinase n=1 Tax=uncultured Tenacibaculum sp. TaxID=174713 RepID=UPI0026050CA3|nr:tetratricopeptide repeat-containing sensor histidine kinase [uncultured Tenacibaculum sp.]
MVKRFLFVLFILLIILDSFSQETSNSLKGDLELFYYKRDSIYSITKDSDFKKLIDFYKIEEFDSSYVYSDVLLLKVNTVLEKDIVNYIQGVSSINKGFYKKALLNFQRMSKDSDFDNLRLLKLGWSHLNLRDYSKAILYFKKWNDQNQNTEKRIKINGYHDLALCYMHLKDYKKAREFFDKELSLLSKKDTISNIKYKIDLANVYYEQYLDGEAIPLFKEAYDLAKIFTDVELKQLTAQNMAVIERNRKRYKESVEYYQEYNKWKDSIWNRDRIIELADRNKKLMVAQKDKEIAIQEAEIKQKEAVQRGLLFGASGLLLFIGALGFFYSKLRKQNTLITKQKEDLAIANKTKNYLFSVVSHDLRSPMNTIKYQHEQLKKHIADNNLEAIEEANNTAITVTESTSHLLNNVLHWSLEQSNQMVFAQKAYPLKSIVEHVLYDYENLIEANAIEISTNYIQNSIVNADRESIKIVLRNLLDNAVKYMNGEGKITVEIGVDNENYSYVSIQDTGIGIPKDRLEKINALKGVSIDKIDRSEGVGLGLILCQTLVKKNKGILSFDSEVGKGTKVTIQLPIADE